MIAEPEREIASGARPVGAPDLPPDAAAANVQHMFDTIAGRYDLLNHMLSGGIDRLWWWRAARRFSHLLSRPESQVLDLCCGTGDMTRALLKRRPSSPAAKPILAVDFSHAMLSRGCAKLHGLNAIAIEADGLHLPLASGSADLVTAAFGFRNLVSYEDGLAELFRVLLPGGEIGILECNQPSGLTGALYNLYFKKVLPRLGGMLSDSAAYRYLPASVERFPRPPRMLQLIHAAGFREASWASYTLGVAGLYRAVKP